MPWNGSGDFSLSDTIAPATNADANELQAILTDIGVGIDASINADGQSPITGALKGADGTALLPAYAFNADLNSGWYRIGADNIGLSLGGTKRIDFGTAGTAITGTLDVSGAATFGGDTHVITSTDAAAAAAPTLDLYRNSASPANSDFIGSVDFNGKDNGAAKQLYAQIITQITDVTAASEDAIIILRAVVAGVLTDMLKSNATGIAIPGTLDITGNVAVNTNKFTVDASTGNTVAAGTIGGTSLTASAAFSGATAAGAMIASQAEQEAGSVTNKLVTPGLQQSHPSAAKAWCSRPGATVGSASPTIGFNVSTVNRTSAGVYTVTFGTAFSSANYVVLAMALGGSALLVATGSSQAAGSCVVRTTFTDGTPTDPTTLMVVCYGDQ